MPRPIRIDFVSDISCPWCIIGLRGLEIALERLGDAVEADIHFQPFELNPAMAPEGENIIEHIGRKYGATPEQSAANRANIRERAASVGFTMAMTDTSRIYNSFDAHRLLHWAGIEGRQTALKHALFDSYFTHGEDISDHDVLIAAAVRAGLDAEQARAILSSDLYATEVREAERLWQGRGIQSVPAIVIDNRYLISGGQPPESFEQALRQIAAEPVQA
ncbi:DsbA family oxidoreductase [Sphingomonas pseudosanguinis]|uniref:Putative DsbA family dithiol-disulfide isomerase n=1 Tax=Sphingomonas pseudosanguinis TaxID=413712 RepID=A0A7W6AC46_9SPHN|nr:DsbA family oxidoreductase [Sphingomonas pseudosanguinis]MBB3880597.1 putative DsbA family dithiol-disulfide isomerase [Sphingomonas pseudosanguinis]MBN3538500.1 DsbA family oxidoreductase [Sphingomonas pseudosanguinis]